MVIAFNTNALLTQFAEKMLANLIKSEVGKCNVITSEVRNVSF